MHTASPITQEAPWEKVPPQDQLFILITGANSGVGLGIAQRLIDEFLATRSLASHLILIPTTRSATKSRETVRTLRAHATLAAQNPTAALRSRAGGGSYSWRQTAARIHVVCLSLDLCDLRGLRGFADRLCRGAVGNPEGCGEDDDGGQEYLRSVRVPRLDSVIYNAAFGGWTGVDWLGAVGMFFAKGIVEMATYPTFKKALPMCVLNDRPEYNYPDKPLLGEVFTACVFGHYCLTHHLLPLLTREPDSPLPPARIIWTSSVEAHAATLSLDSDPQCLARPVAYESAKRLTDILSLTCTLPSARPYSASFLGTTAAAVDEEKKEKTGSVPPRMYLTHPGIVASTLFPLPACFFWLYRLVLALCRLLGSPWHVGTGYRGAAAPTHIAMCEQSVLDDVGAERVKWGSGYDRAGREFVKETEVDGWGWRGTPVDDGDGDDDDESRGPLRRRVGRRAGARDVTADEIVAFEELGVACWREMERLRGEWEVILADDGGKVIMADD